MTCMLAQLGSYIKSTAHTPHVFMAGCSLDYKVVDQITKEFELLQIDTDLCKQFQRQLVQILQLEQILGSISDGITIYDLLYTIYRLSWLWHNVLLVSNSYYDSLRTSLLCVN